VPTLAVCITESHLTAEVKDGEIQISEMTIFRCDRESTKKGGVVIYVNNKFAASTEVILSSSTGLVEMLVLKITRLNLILVTIYRPPRCPINDFSMAFTELERILNEQQAPTPNIIITGDFNFPNICWESEQMQNVQGVSRDDRSQADKIFYLISSHCLYQHVNKPTREENILDLFFTNNDELVNDIEIIPTISDISDHKIINVKTNFYETMKECIQSTQLEHISFKNFNFFNEKVNWEAIQLTLANVRWVERMHTMTVEEKYDFIKETLLKIAKEFVPQRKQNTNKKSTIPRDRRILMRNRTKIIKKLNSNLNDNMRRRLKDKLVEIETAICNSHKNQRFAEETKAINSIKRNSKYFFKYAKKYATTKSSIGPLTAPDGSIVADPKEMCKLLKLQYENVFSKPKHIINIQGSEEDLVPPNFNSLNDINFEENDLEMACKELKLNSAAGPDEIPAIMLQKCRKQLSKPLHLLWLHSFETGIIPQNLKMAFVTPIYKGGGKSKPSNYRPVALTSHIIKVFEKVIKNKMNQFLEDNQLMNTGQHGFRRGRSCLSQLLSHYSRIIDILETGNGADVLYLDFAKAFDKVDHGVLLQKLTKIGIIGKVQSWLKAFITNRNQKVVIEGVQSDQTAVISGVPQGSVLGPLLFLILLSDIDNNVTNSTITSFADDTRITGKISNGNDVQQLQQDLSTVSNWAETNNMLFNDSKFELLRYGVKIPEVNYITSSGHIIERLQEVRDLGIIMSDDATFSSHITKITKTARIISGWILRVFSARDRITMLTLFKSLVLPHLEYCCILWSPYKAKIIQQIEGIQRSFTAKIQEQQLQDKNYWERLK
jgi:hypothetical protein